MSSVGNSTGWPPSNNNLGRVAPGALERGRSPGDLRATAGVGGSVLLVGLFTGYVTRTIVRPVRRAAAMAGRLAAGDFAVRLPETGAAEIGALEHAFNTMGSSLETAATSCANSSTGRRHCGGWPPWWRGLSPPSETFEAVAREVARLLDAPVATLLRLDPNGTATIVATWGELAGDLPIGRRFPVEGDIVATSVFAHRARRPCGDLRRPPPAWSATWRASWASSSAS